MQIMNTINPTLSPNLGGNGLTGGQGATGTNASGGISTANILAAVLAKLQKDNANVSQAEQAVQGGGGAQQGGNGVGGTQGNTDMLKLQQAVTEMNTDNSLGTNLIQGVGDTQKDTAKATH
jgi:hypothetical protein